MKCLTSESADAWAKSNGLNCTFHRWSTLAKQPKYSTPLPEWYGRHVVMLDKIFSGKGASEFCGAGLLITLWGIAGETATIGLFDRLRSLIVGEPLNLAALPFTEFDSQDFDDCYSLVLLAALGRWDAYFMIKGGPSLITFSHDGFLELSPTNSNAFSTQLKLFEEAGFDVKRT